MPYRETSTEIIFNMVDESAKTDSTYDISHSPIKSWCVVSSLNTGVNSNNYMTNELNYSLLDGTKNDLKNDTEDAFISSFISGSDCTFSGEYYLRITFTKLHTLNGITINFEGDYLPGTIRINYYDSTDFNHVLIASKEFEVTDNIFFCDNGYAIENFKEIRIYFLSPKYPYSLIKMNKIDFGSIHTFSGDSIVNAEIFEETDITSNTLSIDTLRFTLYSDSDDFNIDNPKNIYSVLKKRQKVEVYEIIQNYSYDNNFNMIKQEPIRLFMGQFYIKEWTSNSKHTITFNCVDLIGILDDTKFTESRITSSYSFSIAIDDIIESAGLDVSDIIYDNDLALIAINGVFPFCTNREALQMLCFAVGAKITCSRKKYIEISIPDTIIDYNIPDENNFGVISAKVNPIVTGIAYNKKVIAFPNIDGESMYIISTLVDTTVDVGNNQTIFIENMYIWWEPDPQYPSPYIDTDESTATATIDETQSLSMLHKIVVNVTSAGRLVIKGYTYKIVKNAITKYNPNYESYEPNIIDITNCDIIDQEDIISGKMLEYFDKRNTYEYKFLITNEETGKWCLFKNMYGTNIKGNLLSMNIDLTGGFVAKGKFVCCEELPEERYFYVCGQELISGDDISII